MAPAVIGCIIAMILMVTLVLAILALFYLYRHRTQVSKKKVLLCDKVESAFGLVDNENCRMAIGFDKDDENVHSKGIKILLYNDQGNVICSGIIDLEALCNSGEGYTALALSFSNGGIAEILTKDDKDIFTSMNNMSVIKTLESIISDYKESKVIEGDKIEVVADSLDKVIDLLSHLEKAGEQSVFYLNKWEGMKFFSDVMEERGYIAPIIAEGTEEVEGESKRSKTSNIKIYKDYVVSLLADINKHSQAKEDNESPEKISDENILSRLSDLASDTKILLQELQCSLHKEISDKVISGLEANLPMLGEKVERDKFSSKLPIRGMFSDYNPKGKKGFRMSLNDKTDASVREVWDIDQTSMEFKVSCHASGTDVKAYDRIVNILSDQTKDKGAELTLDDRDDSLDHTLSSDQEKSLEQDGACLGGC